MVNDEQRAVGSRRAARGSIEAPLLPGEDLACHLQKSGPLGIAAAVDILLPVCAAMAAAHEDGIVHGDLNPSNIFLAIRDGRICPTVLGFCIMMDWADRSNLGPSNLGPSPGNREKVPGTPCYLAPEQIADCRFATGASDQYALGVILYECLTGIHPFKGNEIDASFRLLRESEPRWPSAVRSDIPSALDQVILRAIARDPLERFASVEELARSLSPFASRRGRRGWAVPWTSERRYKAACSARVADPGVDGRAVEGLDTEESLFVSALVRQALSERASVSQAPCPRLDVGTLERVVARISRKHRRIRIAVGAIVGIVLAVGAGLLRGEFGAGRATTTNTMATGKGGDSRSPIKGT